VIVASAVDDDPLFAAPRGTGFPYVLIGPEQQNVEHHVDVDNRAGACNRGYPSAQTPLRPDWHDHRAAQHRGQRASACAATAMRSKMPVYPLDDSLVVNGNYDAKRRVMPR